MKLATYNVENLFDRPKAMNLATWQQGKNVLEDFKELNKLIQQPVYDAATKTALLQLMGKHPNLMQNGKSDYILLRENRGKFLKKQPNGTYDILAAGRADWIGWFELVTEEVDETATENTGRIIGLMQPDVIAVIEAEDRIGLKRFNKNVLPKIGCPAFDHIMLIDGNDERGIDVGLMTRKDFPILRIQSHVDDTDDHGLIFSRDCAEYEIRTPNGGRLLLLVNHFKSKGYGKPAASAAKRLRQAARVREILLERRREGYEHIAVLGDLNDIPNEPALAPLYDPALGLIDIMTHTRFVPDGRPGTHGNGTASAKLDYIFMTSELATAVVTGGIERRGVWGGKHGTLFPHLATIQNAKDAASDHAALWVELAL